MLSESSSTSAPDADAGAAHTGSKRPEEAELEHSVDLVRRAQAGDLEAYNRLFERYYLRVLDRVRKRMGPALRRDQDSQDVAQEAMVEAIRDFERFDVRDRRGLLALFAAIVENRLRTGAKRQRAQKRDREREVALGFVRDALQSGTLSLEPPDDGPAPSEQASLNERQALLRRCIEALDERDRRLIHLRDYDGRTWDQIAAAVGASSPNAARMMHARAAIRLKKHFEGRLRP